MGRDTPRPTALGTPSACSLSAGVSRLSAKIATPDPASPTPAALIGPRKQARHRRGRFQSRGRLWVGMNWLRGSVARQERQVEPSEGRGPRGRLAWLWREGNFERKEHAWLSTAVWKW